MTKKTYLLQIESVNIYDSLKTTEQLSVRRGTCIAYRNIMFDIEKLLQETTNVETISLGGSIAIFKLTAMNKKEMKALKTTIVSSLYEGNFDSEHNPENLLLEGLPYLNLIVEYAPLTDDKPQIFQTALATMTRKIRFQQLNKYPSFPLRKTHQLSSEPTKEGEKICTDDGFLPADTTVKKNDGNDYHVSSMAKAFFEYGRNAKHAFVFNEIERFPASKSVLGDNLDDTKKTITFTNDFPTLTTLPKYSGASESQLSLVGNLNNKMAVLYFDGNGFSKYKKELSAEGLKQFDENIMQSRASFLAYLLKYAKGGTLPLMYDDPTKNSDNNKVKQIKVEILEWGGDELLFVVPAWAAFPILSLFYQTQQGLQSPDQHPLTHAGGMVICSHKTRIDRAKSIAIEAAEQAKRFSRSRNLYNIVLLESEAYLTQPIVDYWYEHYGELGRTWLPFEYPIELDKQSDDVDIEMTPLKSQLNISALRKQVFAIYEACDENKDSVDYKSIDKEYIKTLNSEDEKLRAKKHFLHLKEHYLNVLDITYKELRQEFERSTDNPSEQDESELKKYECYLSLNKTLQPLLLFIEYLDYLHHLGPANLMPCQIDNQTAATGEE